MDKLKRQVIKYFLLFAFIIALLQSMLDSLFDDYLYYIIDKNTIQMEFFIVSYVFISIFIFIFFSFCYYKVINKEIKKESIRQINEKNLLYANITHDLKTPITSIVGFSKAIKDGKIESEEMDEVINIIHEKAIRTDELINMLFRYSKLETNTYELNMKEQDICALVRRVVAESYEEFEAKEMVLDIDIPDKDIICNLDTIEFKRVINNIILNAYKHNKIGTKVHVSVKEIENKVMVAIADNGELIEKDLIKEIFNPFVCGNESRNSNKGTGLGLAISEKIIHRHGGSIYIEDGFRGYIKGFIIEIKRSCI